MKDEEIIKAFEYCTNTKGSCKTCCYSFIRNGELACNHKKRNKDILEIINRLKEENASLTVENEVLKRDVQNLERTLEECRYELTEVKHDYDMELAEHSEYIRGIDERVSIGHASVHKETAKEILGILLECSEMVETDGQEFPFIYTENIFSLAKKYGVEVKE